MQTALQVVRTPTGQTFTDIDRRTGEFVRKEWFAISWRPLGEVKDMAEAKALFGGSPVLEDAR